MSVIKSSVSTRSEDFAQNRESMLALVRDLKDGVETVKQGGGEKARQRHLDRGKLLPRDRVRNLLDPGAPFLELSQLAAFGMYGGEVPSAGIITGIGRVAGRECLVVANDATVKGGTYYPITVKKHLRAQEIAAAEPSALHLSGGLRRRLPAEPGRGLSRPRALRAHLLQPGQHVGQGHSADRRGHGLLHRGRRLRAGDERRDRHRAQPGHGLPGRAAAGEGGDGRGGLRRGPGRRRRAFPDLGRHRPLCRDDTPRAGHRPAHRGANLNQVPRARPLLELRPRASRPTTRRRSTASSRPTCASPTTCARSSRGWSTARRVRRVQAALRHDAGLRLRADLGHPVGIVANNGILFSESALKGAHFIELCAQRKASRLLFLQNITGFMVGRKYESGGIAKDGAKLVTAVATRQGAEVHGHHRRLLRRRELRHVRPRLFGPRFLWMWPNGTDLGDGRRAGGDGPGDHPPRRHRGPRRDLARGRGGRLPRADPGAVRAPGASDLCQRPPLGRRP